MDPITRIQQDIIAAMKSGQKERLDTLRFLMAQLKNAQIDKGREATLTDQDLQQIVRKMVKNSEEAIEQYRAGGRQDLADEEITKVEVWKTYLPQQLSDGELTALVKETIEKNPGLGIGPLTGMVMKAAGGQADGGAVSKKLRELLSE